MSGTEQEQERRGPRPPDEGGPAYRFEDPWWDEAFATYYDPSMRVCSGRGCW